MCSLNGTSVKVECGKHQKRFFCLTICEVLVSISANLIQIAVNACCDWRFWWNHKRRRKKKKWNHDRDMMLMMIWKNFMKFREKINDHDSANNFLIFITDRDPMTVWHPCVCVCVLVTLFIAIGIMIFQLILFVFQHRDCGGVNQSTEFRRNYWNSLLLSLVFGEYLEFKQLICLSIK